MITISEVQKKKKVGDLSQPHSLKRCLHGWFYAAEASGSLNAGVKPPQLWRSRGKMISSKFVWRSAKGGRSRL